MQSALYLRYSSRSCNKVVLLIDNISVCQVAVIAADVVPIFLAVIEEHRNAATRDKLTFALFNLVKKPTPGQRHLIADSCADLAARIGPSRTAEELLPQCWEQVARKLGTSLQKLCSKPMSAA